MSAFLRTKPHRRLARACFLSSFLRAISAAFSSFVMPIVLFVAEGTGEVSACPISDGVVDRTPEEGLGVASGEDTRGMVACRVG